jgi:hypothetical protein
MIGLCGGFIKGQDGLDRFYTGEKRTDICGVGVFEAEGPGAHVQDGPCLIFRLFYQA